MTPIFYKNLKIYSNVQFCFGSPLDRTWSDMVSCAGKIKTRPDNVGLS